MMRWVGRISSRRVGAALFAATLLALGSVRPIAGASFDPTGYEPNLALDTWADPVDLAESLTGAKIVLHDVYLVAEGREGREVYASSCPGGRSAGPGPEVLEARCPWVYLGQLPAEDAARRLQRLGDRRVDVYFTVGQIVPRPFSRQFGMLEAADGAWVEAGDESFGVQSDSRVFGLPDEQVVAAESAEDVVPPRPATPPKTAEAALGHFIFAYRLIHEREGQEERTEPRPLARTSLLCGRTEFVFETTAPEWFEVESVTVTGREGLYGANGRMPLCESTATPNACVADFGPGIAGQRFTVEAVVIAADGSRLTLSREFATPDTHPSRIGTTGTDLHRDKLPVGPAVDEVVRLVRIETREDGETGVRVDHRVDFGPDGFRIDVEGIEGAEIRSVVPPPLARENETVALLIPIFVNVSPYLAKRAGDREGFGWREAYTGGEAGIVRKLRHGLERAAWNGVSAEFLVVEYAATARMFGPFRLHPGRELSEERKAQNRRALDSLEAHMRQPPLAEWDAERLGAWVSDVSAPLFTLNDLYFKTFPGLVSVLLVSDGWNNPVEPLPRFLLGLWPERLQLLNRTLTPSRTARILDLLDAGRSLQDETDDALLAGAGEDDGLTSRQLVAYVRGLDPGAIATPHPHRENRLPPMDALLVPGPVPLRRETQRIVTRMIREDFGGEIYQLYQVRKTPDEPRAEHPRSPQPLGEIVSFSQVIERIHDQLRASYVVVATVPNEKQDGRQHALRFTAAEKPQGSRGRTKHRPIEGRLCYMPYYTSSRSVRDKTMTLALSPFGLLRLLTAYELRHHWDDSFLSRLLEQRMETEADPVVRRTLLESAIAIELKRLQVTAGEVDQGGKRWTYRREAYDRLQALAERADALPDPQLAREAARLARRYRDESGEE